MNDGTKNTVQTTSSEEIEEPPSKLSYKVTDYYYSRFKDHPQINKTFLPDDRGNIVLSCESGDHLGEEKQSPVENLGNDWHWQIKNSITTLEDISKHLVLTDEEKNFFKSKQQFKFRITPYYLDLIKKNPNSPIRKSLIPNNAEFNISNGESIDPLGEDSDTCIPNLIKRYPDRVLYIATDFCSANCRYCCRSRLVGHEKYKDNFPEILEYLNTHSEIRDVIVSGGDPMTLSDKRLDFILSRLYAIPHIQIIRIGTKVPVVLPQRITTNLLNILNKFWDKLFINIHFIHEDEISLDTKNACLKLARLGIPLGSQTVLLKGINDNIESMKKLVQKLLSCKVIPRYLYQMDKIQGGDHFRTSIEKGIEIIKGIQGFTSGMCCPKYVVDSHYGKIPIDIGSVRKKENGVYVLRNYEGKETEYRE